MPTIFDVCHAKAAAADGGAPGDHRAHMLQSNVCPYLLPRWALSLFFLFLSVHIDTYTESPRGGTLSTSTPTRSPLEAGHHLHQQLNGAPLRRGAVYADLHGVPSRWGSIHVNAYAWHRTG